jgi:MFS family permease
MNEIKMTKGRNIMLKISLLSCVVIMASIGAINGIIPEIAKAFPNVSLSTVELISTIPSLFLMISILISRNIAKAIGYKRTIQTGIGVTAVCGIVPIFFNNIYLILISRALLGFGVGMFASLLVALICYFYDGQERSMLIGFQGMVVGLGGLVVTFVSGQLVKINWQASFLAYLIAIPVFILFSVFVPSVSTTDILAKNSNLKKKNAVETGKESYLPVVGFVLLIFVSYTLYMTMGIKESSLITTIGYGTVTDGSTVIMLLCVGSMISGLLYGKYSGFTKKFTTPIGFLLMGTAIILMGISNSVPLTVFGGFLAGFSNQFLAPYMTETVNKGSAKRGGIATSMLLVSQNLGSFLAPYGSILLGKLSPVKNIRGIFYTDGTILLILASAGIVFAVIATMKSGKLQAL